MIIKQLADVPTPADPRLAAGVAAERQMAFYLHRAFATNPDVLVLNDLRLVDPEQADPNGSPGVCQIDHLVMHRWGAFIVESKSVSEEVAVESDGSGGDMWSRRYRGRQEGIASPIQQARRQAEFLRVLLQRHRSELLGKAPVGTRTALKLLLGSDQRGFRSMPFQIIVAISDGGKIHRASGWKEPTEPFRTYVAKADLVVDKINLELEQHRKHSSLLKQPDGKYGIWSMKQEEVAVVAAFLADHHAPREAISPQPVRAPVQATHYAQARAVEPPPNARPEPARAQATPAAQQPPTHEPARSPVAARLGPICKACLSPDLTANWGKFGYYWKCNACGTNTAMPAVCSACGTEGQRGQTVRIRKDGPKYFRDCESCGISERIWTQS